MRYAAYVVGVFTVSLGLSALYLGSARKNYRKRYGK